MQAGKRYSFVQTVIWSSRYIIIFIIWDTIPVFLHSYFKLEWMHLPWQPISLIGVAVAFYLGFKNNSSYDRLWEARKIWGGIVNASRSFTVMVINFINNDEASNKLSTAELKNISKTVVHRHIAWLHALTLEMRKVKEWEHDDERHHQMRHDLGLDYKESNFSMLKEYISNEDFEYVMSKGNRSSHLLSVQTKHLMALRNSGHLEHFRHLEIQALITELYALQGKSERIKNFPFPRQYASVNYFFVVIFIALLPFGMLDIFHDLESSNWLWVAIPFSVIGSWVYWMMELIGDYSENPFEGLHNDVPITSMARGIEIDIRQMLDETDLPDPIKPTGDLKLLI